MRVYPTADDTPGMQVEDRGFSLGFYDAMGRHPYGYQVLNEYLPTFIEGTSPDVARFAMAFGNMDGRMLVVERNGQGDVLVSEEINGEPVQMANGAAVIVLNEHAFDAWRTSWLADRALAANKHEATIAESLQRRRGVG